MLFGGHIFYFNTIFHNEAFQVVPNSCVRKARKDLKLWVGRKLKEKSTKGNKREMCFVVVAAVVVVRKGQ